MLAVYGGKIHWHQDVVDPVATALVVQCLQRQTDRKTIDLGLQAKLARDRHELLTGDARQRRAPIAQMQVQRIAPEFAGPQRNQRLVIDRHGRLADALAQQFADVHQALGRQTARLREDALDPIPTHASGGPHGSKGGVDPVVHAPVDAWHQGHAEADRQRHIVSIHFERQLGHGQSQRFDEGQQLIPALTLDQQAKAELLDQTIAVARLETLRQSQRNGLLQLMPHRQAESLLQFGRLIHGDHDQTDDRARRALLHLAQQIQKGAATHVPLRIAGSAAELLAQRPDTLDPAANRRHQVPRPDGFGQKIIAADLDGLKPCLLTLLAGQKHDRQNHGIGLQPQLRGQGQTVDAGQVQIHEDQIRLELAYAMNHGGRVHDRLDPHAGAAQDGLAIGAHLAIVIDNEHPEGLGILAGQQLLQLGTDGGIIELRQKQIGAADQGLQSRGGFAAVDADQRQSGGFRHRGGQPVEHLRYRRHQRGLHQDRLRQVCAQRIGESIAVVEDSQLHALLAQTRSQTGRHLQARRQQKDHRPGDGPQRRRQLHHRRLGVLDQLIEFAALLRTGFERALGKDADIGI